jgi:hypothetical protein
MVCDGSTDIVRSLFDVIYINNAANVGVVFSQAIDTGTGGRGNFTLVCYW